MSRRILLPLSCILFAAQGLSAGEVEVMFVELQKQGAQTWRVAVTLRHDDTGWQHYADAWRVGDERGQVIATRVLHHPHVNEQPFTRSLSEVAIPQGWRTIVVDAHDTVHGWSPQRVRIELDKTGGERFSVTRQQGRR